MRRFEQVLPGLFWLPILLSGAVGIALVDSRFYKVGIVSAAVLALFMIVVFLQLALECRAVLRRRSKQPANKKPASVATVANGAIAAKNTDERT